VTLTDPAVTVAPGFEPVAEAFERNFHAHDELGAAFAAVVGGKVVVDLWGGVADRTLGIPWQQDTMTVIFSGTKGLAAICVLLLIERGELTLDTRVAERWPEFGAAGKEEIRVRELVTHTAKLPAFVEPISLEEFADDRRTAALLAAQPQLEDPRAARCYHPFTFGWLLGELVRRVDGRSIGRFFQEEVAGPLGLDAFIGLPEELEGRVARLEVYEGWPNLPEGYLDDPLNKAISENPADLLSAVDSWNSRLFHGAEIPGAGGITTARSMAELYGRLEAILAPETIELASTELERRIDGTAPPEETVESVFGVGFQLQNDLKEMGPPVDAFGHGGSGGSIHGRWPTLDVGFSYAMNLLRGEEGDPRSRELLKALHDCVAK
jgi:CubicO group peptidase (beta-lactamase class C family)